MCFPHFVGRQAHRQQNAKKWLKSILGESSFKGPNLSFEKYLYKYQLAYGKDM